MPSCNFFWRSCLTLSCSSVLRKASSSAWTSCQSLRGREMQRHVQTHQSSLPDLFVLFPHLCHSLCKSDIAKLILDEREHRVMVFGHGHTRTAPPVLTRSGLTYPFFERFSPSVGLAGSSWGLFSSVICSFDTSAPSCRDICAKSRPREFEAMDEKKQGVMAPKRPSHDGRLDSVPYKGPI
jgi:hypothetical protein